MGPSRLEGHQNPWRHPIDVSSHFEKTIFLKMQFLGFNSVFSVNADFLSPSDTWLWHYGALDFLGFVSNQKHISTFDYCSHMKTKNTKNSDSQIYFASI